MHKNSESTPWLSAEERRVRYQSVFACLQRQELEQAAGEVQDLLRILPEWPTTYSLQAAVAMQSGDLPLAEVALTRAHALAPTDAEPVFNLVQVLRAQQKTAQALAFCLALTDFDLDRDLCGLKAEMLVETGQPEAARDWLLRAEALVPQALPALQEWLDYFWAQDPTLAWSFFAGLALNHPARLELGEKLARLAFGEQLGEGIRAAWTQVLQTGTPVSWHNLGICQYNLGQQPVALCSFLQALQLDPACAPAAYHAGMILLESGQIQAGREQLLRALDLEPQLTARLYETALAHLFQERPQICAEYLDLCESRLAFLPVSKEDFYHRSAQCAHLNCADEKKLAFFRKAAHQAQSESKYELEALFSLPYIYRSLEELQQLRKNFVYRLEKLQNRYHHLIQQGKPLPPLNLAAPFLLAYQGQDERPLMQKTGTLLTEIFSAHGQLQQQCHAPGRGRIRIGFASEFFFQHSVMVCYGDMLAAFGAHRDFECVIFHLGPHRDQRTDVLASQVDAFYHVPDPRMAMEQMRQQKLDILIYTDLGMTLNPYLLAFQRLAPIQCVLAGHPLTTGIPNLDYFFSNAMFEPEQAPAHYTEQLLALPFGNGSLQKRLQIPARPVRPACWPLDRHIYFCPMTLFKLHPEFDDLVEGILERDPRGEVWFVEDASRPLTGILASRFRRRMPAVAGRIHFMPWMSTQDFYQAVLCADAVLDSLHFGAGTTVRMVLGLGQPMVTLPGRFLRGRMTLGVYRKLGLESWASDSKQAYIDRCLALAADPALRHDLSRQLAERTPVLFENPSNFENMQNLVRRLVSQYPTPLRDWKPVF